MLGFFEEMTPGKAVVGLCAGAVMLTVWVLNAVFTFTYGADVIGPFLLESQLGADGSALLSGLVALIFYDASYTVAFMVLLFACRSNWQYGIVGIQFALCFLASIMASATSIILLSPLGNDIPEIALMAARYLSYAGLVLIFAVDALATVGYIATRPEMSAKIAQSIHEASQTADTEKFNKELRKKARLMAHDLVRDDLPELAKQEATAIRENFRAALPERAGAAVVIDQPEKYQVWLGTKGNERQTKGSAYGDFMGADQAARRMSFGMVTPGTMASVYYGNERLASYEALGEDGSTADDIQPDYEETPDPLPARPSNNGLRG